MRETRQQFVARLRLFWEARKLLFAVFVLGALASLGLALLIPSRYEATTQLMPPDGQSSSGMAMLSALAGRAGGLGGVAGDLLGVKNSGALFVGILESRTVQDRLVEQFELRRLYRSSRMEDARGGLAAHTRIVEDRKSGIIALTVADHDPRLAAAMAPVFLIDEAVTATPLTLVPEASLLVALPCTVPTTWMYSPWANRKPELL